MSGFNWTSCKADGTLDKLKRPLHIFTGLQFEHHTMEPVEGDVLVVGDCAKPMLERFPNAQYWGSMRGVPELHTDLGQSSGRRDRELRQATKAGTRNPDR